MTEEPDNITLAECKQAGLCMKGVRGFMDISDTDFRDFARNGISVEDARKKDGWQAFVDHIMSVRAQRRG